MWIMLVTNTASGSGKPTVDDAKAWKETYSYANAFADPDNSMIPPGKPSAAPHYTVVDPRDMTVQLVQAGLPTPYEQVEALADKNKAASAQK